MNRLCISLLSRKCTKFYTISFRNKNKLIKDMHWAKARNTVFPAQIAMQHFDNFYANVYGNRWKSIRIGLLSDNKYCAVVNIFGDCDDTEIKMRQLGAVDMRLYYERHWKRYERYKRRMQILEEKKMKKIERIAQETGVDVSQINAETIEVSDVSDRALGSDLSPMTSEAEDFIEMISDKGFQTEGFINMASQNIDLSDYIPSTELKYQEEVINEKSYFEFYQSDIEIPFQFVDDEKIDFPEILKIYTFPRGNVSNFPGPNRSKHLGMFDYYLLDGASLIPVLALGIQPKDFVADYCAAPGGKALMMMLSMRPLLLRCNDMSQSRSVRLKSVFKSYIPDLPDLKRIMMFTNDDAKDLKIKDGYDKILVDVPCTNDRLSISDNENNIFKSGRLQERLKLPQEQMDILFAALCSLRVNGSLVYSTCSLSPIQNDGVVHMALKRIWEETNYEFVICNLRESLRPFRGLYRLYHKFKYGSMVLPFIPSNYGPMFISKIKRIK